ncbi:MAG: hypothetical protein ACXWKC_17905 [Xanthobacteraceae bacterium]
MSRFADIVGLLFASFLRFSFGLRLPAPEILPQGGSQTFGAPIAFFIVLVVHGIAARCLRPLSPYGKDRNVSGRFFAYRDAVSVSSPALP